MDKEERGPGNRRGPQRLEEPYGQDDPTAVTEADAAAPKGSTASQSVAIPGSLRRDTVAMNDGMDARERAEVGRLP